MVRKSAKKKQVTEPTGSGESADLPQPKQSAEHPKEQHYAQTNSTEISNFYFTVAVMMSCLKLLTVHLYRSTDYEVHRNWLAITFRRPLDKWYFEDKSEWTLDYPPFFAWFEFILSGFAEMFDKEMLKVENLNYLSEMSVLYQKLTVIVTDFLYLYAVKYFAVNCLVGKDMSIWTSSRFVLTLALMCNFGLFILDHIHFQYNGFMFGILLISITDMYKGMFRSSALNFACLLNFKHIYLYMAPAYGIYLLRMYCFESDKSTGTVLWRSFYWRRFLLLAGIVLSVFGLSFGPFIYLGQLGQVLSRLFPFKRGLCHAYWAPNFWALYNIADKALHTAGRQAGYANGSSNAGIMTGGLVQEFEHTVLPTIKPIYTFILTIVFWQPAVIHLWFNPMGPRSFLKCLVISAFTSFMFGWHVHEKAILMVVIPLTLLAVENNRYSKLYFILSTVANLSLFPLIFTNFEQPLLYIGFILYTVYTFISFNQLCIFRDSKIDLNIIEKLYMAGLIPVMLYYSLGHRIAGLTERLPFLPLLMISVYTAIGVFYCYVMLYITILKERMVIKMKRT